MTKRKHLLLGIIAVISTPVLLQAQQNYDALRKKYLAFVNEQYNPDSAIIYALKARTAAIKEFGQRSPAYFKATNSVGYAYFTKEQHDSAGIWWLQSYRELKGINGSDFLQPISSVSLNLKTYYSRHSINADSAIFFAYRYIDAIRQLNNDSGREYLNSLCDLAIDIESSLGAPLAAQFYTLAQMNWAKQLGTASLTIIKGIDSVLRANPVTNTVGRRKELYHIADTLGNADKLRQLFRQSNNTYESIGYAAELLHIASKNKEKDSREYIEALQMLGLAYYNAINERPVAVYLVKQALAATDANPANYALREDLSATLRTIETPFSGLKVVQPEQKNIEPADKIIVNGSGTEPKLILPISHPQGIVDAKYSADEKYVVTKSFNDQNAKLWLVETGELIGNLTMENGVRKVLFTNDNQYVITVGASNIITWNRESGQKRTTIHTNKTFSFSFIPDTSNSIVTVDSTNNIQQWNLTTGELITSAACRMRITDCLAGKKPGTAVFFAQDSQMGSVIFEYDFASGNSRLVFKNRQIDGYLFSDNRIVPYTDGRAFVFDRQTYALANVFNIEKRSVTSGSLTQSGDKLLLCYDNKTLAAYTTVDGNTISFFDYKSPIEDVEFIGAGNNFVLRANGWASVTRTDKQTALYYILGDTLSRLNRRVEPFIRISKDQKRVMMVFSDNVLRIWNLLDSTATLQQAFSSETRGLNTSSQAPAGEQMMIGTHDGILKMLDPLTGKILFSYTDSVEYPSLESRFSKDGRLALVYSALDSAVNIFDIGSEKIIRRLRQNGYSIRAANFSNDGKLIVTATIRNEKGWVTIWDWANQKIVKRFPVIKANEARFDPTDKKLLISHLDSTVSVYNLTTNKSEARIVINDWPFSSAYKANNRYILNIAANSINLLDGKTFKLIRSFTNDYSTGSGNVVFTKDASRIVMGSAHGIVTIRDIATGKILQSFQAHASSVSVFLSADEKWLITASEDATIKVWDFNSLKFLYQIVPLSGKDYLVADAFNRYDGTEAARKLLYFTCGTEVIGLDQVKDQLWVPGLAERILKGEKIDAPTLADLNICGLTPLVTRASGTTDSNYRFTITPRNGGLSETVLYVNDIEIKRYKAADLAKSKDGYELEVTAASVKDLFVPGKENKVMVKAYTAEKSISSRGVGYKRKESSTSATAPNVYAVMVGVSDYKGEKLDLNYAAKDAADLSKAVAASARKLLNTNGAEHVFVYNLTAEKNQAINATKKSIKETFADIASKAKSDDILLIFFAGHGVMEGEKKQFYFLTADASEASIGSSSIADVSISTAELSEWMQPQRIKAQKRILIFDACNSGQAIADLVAVRDDNASQQVKAIEKLNEKSGLFILSASAVNQSAYEMGVYSQGLLTYTLLKAMKDQPDILDDNKYLNISKWFNAAEKNVNEIVKETGNRQQPQIVSTTNFNLGIVDEDVMKSIVLPAAKPLFTASNFQNSDEAIADDNLDLSKFVNTRLGELAARGAKSNISYSAASNSPDAYSLSGRYEVKGDAITIKVNVKYHKTILHKFEVSGKKDQLTDLAAEIAAKAAAASDSKTAKETNANTQ